jgi:hypothetical protein
MAIYPKFDDECVNNTPDDGNEIKRVPRIFEKILYAKRWRRPYEEERDVLEIKIK